MSEPQGPSFWLQVALFLASVPAGPIPFFCTQESARPITARLYGPAANDDPEPEARA